MSLDFYFAGSQAIYCYDIMTKLNANVLKSYATDRKDLEYWYGKRAEGWIGNLFVDSGAFSVHKSGISVNVDDYIKYLNEHEKDITFYIQLDHIPGKWGESRTSEMTLDSCEKSWDNFKYMYSQLNNPKKLCPVYHMGEPIWALDRILISEYEFDCICISCSKDIQFNQHFDWYDKCIQKIRSYRPNIKVHLLGVGKPHLKQYINMTSMDSTNWIMTGCNGSILTPFGVVAVSSRQQNNANWIMNMSPEAVRKISDYCESCGFTLQEATEDYKVRLGINIHYLFNLSKNIEYLGLTTKRRSLF